MPSIRTGTDGALYVIGNENTAIADCTRITLDLYTSAAVHRLMSRYPLFPALTLSARRSLSRWLGGNWGYQIVRFHRLPTIRHVQYCEIGLGCGQRSRQLNHFEREILSVEGYKGYVV